MNQKYKMEAKAIVYFGNDPSVLSKLKQLFGEECVHPFQEMKTAFEFIKGNPVRSFVFDTYQEGPFRGVNEKDLDIMLYYGSSSESLNKHISFLPIDPVEAKADESNENKLNYAVHYYGGLYDRYLYLLPGITIDELNEESIVLPSGLDFLSNLVAVMDDATDELDQKLEKVNFSGDQRTSSSSGHSIDLSEDVHTVEGTGEDLKDNFSATLKGDGPDLEENSRVGGAVQEDESSQRVKGSNDTEDDHKEVISGDGADDRESTQLVKGSSDAEDDHKKVISGDGADDSESAQLVKGSSNAEDDHKEVISGDGADNSESAQLVKGSSDAEDDHKEVISGDGADNSESAQLVKGSSNAEDDHKEVISGDGADNSESAQLVKGSSDTEDDHKEVISGDGADNSESAQLVKGSSDTEDDHKEVISGETSSPETPLHIIEGEGAQDQTTLSAKVSSENNSSGDSKQVFEGTTEVNEDHKHKTVIKAGESKDEEEDSFYEVKDSSEIEVDDTPIPADMNQRNDKGQTPLMLHALRGNEENVRSLLENGAKPDLLCRKGKTLLHYAIEGKNTKAFIESLIEDYGLKATKRDADGLDPFFYVVTSDYEELISYFIDKGARINTKYKGEPILHIAVKAKALKSFKTLLICGADVKAKNPQGDDIATFCKKKKLLPFLKLIAAVNRLKELKAS